LRTISLSNALLLLLLLLLSELLSLPEAPE